MVDDGEITVPGTWHNIDPSPRNYAPGVRLLHRRTFELNQQESLKIHEVEHWLLGAASKTASAHVLVEGFACRLARAGLGVDRMILNVGTVHPQAYGYAWHWNILDGLCDEIQIGEDTLLSDQFRKNPIFRVIEFGETVRVQLRQKPTKKQSNLMAELAAAGFSEYIAIPLSASGEKHNAVTLATLQANGFTQSQLDSLTRLLVFFALQVERHIANRIAQNISHTYLGLMAGERVVKGTIKRGTGISIRAIVWSSDMRDFSGLSEKRDNKSVADMLNSYFSVLADAVLRNGGDVLKFVGDGMLAVFPLGGFSSPETAALAAAKAAREAVEGLEALNQNMRQQAQWRALRTGIGLHLGDVFFGNIGSAKRLDFTVIGEAVNIATRVERLCKLLKRDILLTAPVAALLGEEAEPMGTKTLKGIQKVEQIFALSNGR
ncbi:adenylate/guanylate cyclase domain-containing protein [Tateyamaria pelophila]|uniref:adenylate/guanylate cyclase domain-containing protein n=1 Tax=Tateyamaria pelophila TaxID=328415 RepID=UPI001CBDF8F8|nr:adenylate/guanylate cyclase domain-containing protein [Tateyamaria pelophila]